MAEKPMVRGHLMIDCERLKPAQEKLQAITALAAQHGITISCGFASSGAVLKVPVVERADLSATQRAEKAAREAMQELVVGSGLQRQVGGLANDFRPDIRVETVRVR